MKKILALLLTVIMLSSISCAWAEETTEEAVEITFQDIPWGSSMKEVENWAKDKGFQTVGRSLSLEMGGPVFLDASGKYSSGWTEFPPDLDSLEILWAGDSDSFQIAGYAIHSLSFYFDVQDGKKELYTVVVRFLPQGKTTNEQAQAILDDLEQKLITVYGENDMPATDDSLSAYRNYSSSGLMTYGANDRYRKLGAEDTAICLNYEMLNGVMLVYGKTNVFVIEETNDTPLTIDSFNLGGL